MCRNAISVEKKYSIAYEKDGNRKNENNNNDFIKCLRREDKGFHCVVVTINKECDNGKIQSRSNNCK